MASLRDCLTQAATYWETKRDGATMVHRAKVCASILGLSRSAPKLQTSDAIHVLAGLRKRGLSTASQASYYAAFRRMLSLAGLSFPTWPNGPVPPRRSREPLSEDALGALMGALEEAGAVETLDLARVLAATGMRVDGEALSFTGWRRGKGQTLHITGKGGHERVIPVADPEAWAILSDPARFRPMMNTSYRTHSRKWKAAAEAARIESKMPTPHAVRHYYATEAYKRCKDIRVVQDLLGHADYGTTARYIGVDIERMRDAVTA